MMNKFLRIFTSNLIKVGAGWMCITNRNINGMPPLCWLYFVLSIWQHLLPILNISPWKEMKDTLSLNSASFIKIHVSRSTILLWYNNYTLKSNAESKFVEYNLSLCKYILIFCHDHSPKPKIFHIYNVYSCTTKQWFVYFSAYLA